MQRPHQQHDQDRYHFFYGGPFSQWLHVAFGYQFELDGVGYNCAEQAMMAAKARCFNDNDALEIIMEQMHPRDQKRAGRLVQNFNKEQWEAVARDRVYAANWAKFTQNKGLLEALMSTGHKILVEASPYDQIWGIGLSVEDAKNSTPENWRGTNWLGQVLTCVREDLKFGEQATFPISWAEQPWR